MPDAAPPGKKTHGGSRLESATPRGHTRGPRTEMKKLLAFTVAALATLSACHTSIREVEPSESFRKALDEVMLRQDSAKRVKADDLERRREPVKLKLSLEACLELAMAHNRAVLFEQLASEVSAAAVIGAKSNLDFTVGANIGYSREENELRSRIPGDSRSREITAVTDVGVNATLPFATGTTLDVRAGFVRSDSNSPFQSFEFFPATTLTVTQHLLNGFGFVPNLGNSWIAENDRTIAQWQVEATRNEQALAVAMAYWNLVEAEEELAVLRAQRELALEALSLAESRFEADIGTFLEVRRQEGNVKAQEVGIIRAESLIEQRTDELIYAIHPDLIHGYALFEGFRIEVEATTRSDDARGSLDDPQLLPEVKAALRRRPEIRQAVMRIQNAGIRIDMSEYGLLPSLDLEGEFGINGAGEDFDEGWESHNKFENLRYGFGLRLSVPLQNSAARSALMQAELNKRSAILAARDVETGIILEVAAAVREITSTRRATEAAQESASIAEENYLAEQQRQSAGLGTSYELKQSETELTEAKLELVRARIDLRRARLQLQKATGELGQ
jgi:outer membrane protein TolC